MWTIHFCYNYQWLAELSIVVTTYFEAKDINFEENLFFG